MASRKQFNVGIVGYGLSAKVFHIPFIALTPSLNLHSILQRNPSQGNSAPADHPNVTHHTALEPFLADPALDIVVLCTPPNTHYPFARAALEAGKHVLVEKPFVPTSAEADALAELARAKGRVLCVYQNRRWDSDFLTVRKLIADGTLGRVVELETHFDRLRIQPPVGSWKAGMGMKEGGGALFDLGTHLLDQVFVLFGMPSGVYAKFVRQREGRLVKGQGEALDEPDSVTLVLSYEETGVVVYVRIGVVSVESKQVRFWVRGSKGSYHKTGLDPQEDQLRVGGKATDAQFGREDESRFGRLSLLGENGSVEDHVCPTVEPETYLKFYELFAKAVENGKEEDIPVPATQAAQVLRIIEAARESAKTGREVAP
ncbi:NAD(P)-binding protein [Parathielavia appendiculata]|uniref:NAD(P)-binding protein n=1 Tax=Parathielavia appendiculata TaxID=2587402 RepID=A0AAN6TS71_9PEZI|nr:NAD(P)-binding protein [Parathielavia appendiculata]